MGEMDQGEPSDLDWHQFIETLLRRRAVLLGAWGTCLLCALLYAFLARPVFRAQTLIEIEKPESMNMGQFMFENPDVNEEYFRTQYRLIKSDLLTQKVYDDLDLYENDDFAPPRGLEKLQAAIKIVPESQTRLAYVRVDSHYPDIAVRISTSLAAEYVAWNSKNALFMSREVLQSLQLSHEGMDPRHIYESLPAVIENRVIQAIKDQKIGMEAQVAELTQKYTASHPSVMAAKSRMESLDRLLQSETDKIIASVKTQLSGKLMGNNVRVIDWARRPMQPVRPRKVSILLLGFCGGMLAGGLLALFVDRLDQSIRTEEDVNRRLQRPFLGAVPSSPRKADATAYDHLLVKEQSLASESFRNLRAMIDYAGSSSRVTPLLVTSALKEEGKSYVASNLAVAFSQLGEKVLLIDGDLRRPSLHRNFALPSQHGVSSFLAGAVNADGLPGLAQKTRIENLSAMPCGRRPPGPAELLNTPRLEALVAWASANFARVIVDCAPVYPVNDALLWGRHVRSAVFVTKCAATRAPLILNACGRLQGGGIRNLGIVVNFARSFGPGYDDYDHYSSGYAEEEDPGERAS